MGILQKIKIVIAGGRMKILQCLSLFNADFEIVYSKAILCTKYLQNWDHDIWHSTDCVHLCTCLRKPVRVKIVKEKKKNKFLVITRTFLVYSRKYLVISKRISLLRDG